LTNDGKINIEFWIQASSKAEIERKGTSAQ